MQTVSGKQVDDSNQRHSARAQVQWTTQLSRHWRRSVGSLTLTGLMALTGLPALGNTQIPSQPVSSSGIPARQIIEEGYVLGPGDRVSITIFNVPEHSGEYPVLVDGTVNLPLVGPVAVAGLTLEQAEQVLSQEFSRFLKRPLITVGLVAARPIEIAVAGEVNRPGAYEVEQGLVTVADAIELAGGITRVADVRNVQIRRPHPGNTGPDQTITVNLWELLQLGDINQNLRLQDGDSLIIPADTDIDMDEATLLATTSFSADRVVPIDVTVIGAVHRPGPHVVGPTNTESLDILTLSRAIQQAGGITQTADIRRVQIRRKTKAGETQTIAINLWKLLQAGDESQDIPIQSGDTIIIPTAEEPNPSEITELASSTFSPETIRVNIAGEVRNPGIVELQPNTPLNQAIFAAGGFNGRSKSGSVELVRLNQNGTVNRNKFDVDLDENVGEAGNPPLRDNDTIVVRRNTLAKGTDILRSVLAPITGAFSILRILDLN